MITFLPTILQQGDESLALPASVEAYERWSTLLPIAFRIEKAFLDWFQTTMTQLSLCQSTLVSSLRMTWGLDPQSAQPKITFPNIYTTRLFLLYWSSMILLCESIVDLLRSIEIFSEPANLESSDRHRPLYEFSMPENYIALSHKFATNIHKSVRFCVQTETGVVGKTFILLPLWMARDTF